MKYALVILEPASDFASRSNEHAQAYWGKWKAFNEALAAAGIVPGGAALQPPATATTVRLKDGSAHVQDGPYAATKEQLGGFMIIDVPDLDAALKWAARCPAAATGVVEVRPVVPMMP